MGALEALETRLLTDRVAEDEKLNAELKRIDEEALADAEPEPDKDDTLADAEPEPEPDNVALRDDLSSAKDEIIIPRDD